MKKGKLIVVLACMLTLALVLFTGCGGNTEDTVKEIGLASAPTKTEYVLGEELDLNGAKIRIEMTSGSTREIDVTEEMVSGYNAQTVGEQTVTVVYEQTEMTFTVTVKAPTVSKEITLKSAPSKTEYAYGETLVLDGAKIEVKSSDGTIEVDVTEEMVSGYNAQIVGEQTITVSYDGTNMTFKVTVVDALKTVTLKSAPTKTTYDYGESIVLDGAEIHIERQSGKTEDIAVTNAMVSGYNAQTVGEQTVTVSYGGTNMTFKVTVVDTLSDITLLSAPRKRPTVTAKNSILSVRKYRSKRHRAKRRTWT